MEDNQQHCYESHLPPKGKFLVTFYKDLKPLSFLAEVSRPTLYTGPEIPFVSTRPSTSVQWEPMEFLIIDYQDGNAAAVDYFILLVKNECEKIVNRFGYGPPWGLDFRMVEFNSDGSINSDYSIIRATPLHVDEELTKFEFRIQHSVRNL